MIQVIARIIARNPPSIVMVFAGLLALTGQTKEAYDFLLVGILMQALWITAKYGLFKR